MPRIRRSGDGLRLRIDRTEADLRVLRPEGKGIKTPSGLPPDAVQLD